MNVARNGGRTFSDKRESERLMKKNVVTTDPITGLKLVSQDVIDALETNGTYLPDVKRVVFSLKTTEKVAVKNADGSEKKVPAVNKDGSEIKTKDGKTVMKTVFETKKLDNPVLVTKVWWADNTTTTVKNSEHDRIETEEIELEDGKKVTVASECSKTFGIMAAVTKRTCGIPGDDGEMIETNVGKILTDIVGSAYDQQVEEAKAKIQKAKAKEKAEAQKAKAKQPKPKKYSGKELLQLAGPILEAIAAKVAENPELLADILKGSEKGA